MINFKVLCILINYGIFFMIKLIPFDKIFENSGVVLLFK